MISQWHNVGHMDLQSLSKYKANLNKLDTNMPIEFHMEEQSLSGKLKHDNWHFNQQLVTWWDNFKD